MNINTITMTMMMMKDGVTTWGMEFKRCGLSPEGEV